MADTQEPHHADSHPAGSHRAAHTLGPHVVGQRVVVRRIVRGETGPSGGPAMTDVLGTCTAWGEGRCVVEPESGPPVSVALGDIVSGKPVPPRPPVRHRVAPSDAQRRAFALFPDLDTEPVGRWVLRRSRLHRARRANSVLAFEPSGMVDDIDRVTAFYERPVAAVLPGSEQETSLRRLGWVVESHDADSVFMLGSVSGALRASRDALRARPRLQTDSVSVRESPPGLASAHHGDLGSGVAACADDWLGFRGLHVLPDHRGQGIALMLMHTLLEWGAEKGAGTAYLQVLGDNTPALGLYARLGFREHHRYRYLTPG